MPKHKQKHRSRDPAPVIAPICPYCGSTAVCEDSAKIYGRSYGMAWICPKYPACDSYVGCHRVGSGMAPLGRMANPELRAAKKRAHAAFDKLWHGNGGYTRDLAYKALATGLGIERKDCHIGMFDVEMCNRVVEVCS